MPTRFYDTPANDDAVRLLSNPLNNENLQCEEFESSEEARLNGSVPLCSTCGSLPPREANISQGYLENDGLVSIHQITSTANGNCRHCHQFLLPHLNAYSRSKLVIALCLCMVFMVAEMVGGYMAGSVALVSDGAHLLTDVVGLVISLIAISTSKKKSTKSFNLGFYRIEVLTSLSSVLLIWIMTGVFMYVATMRLMGGVYMIDVNSMILVSFVGVLINVAMIFVLHGSCHRAHVHSHHTSLRESSKGENINVRAAIIHVIGDLVQTVGVLLSSIVIKYYPNAKFMDPVCTFMFSIVVICSTLKLLKDSIYILMEGFPGNLDYNSILISLQGLSGVRHVHSLCVWSLTLEKNVLVAHLAVDDSADRDLILFQAQRLLSTKFGINNHTIQIEKYHPNCIHACQNCKPLWG